MSVALALLATVAAGALPQLPQRGLALETKTGVQLQTLAGRPIATLPGLDLAPDKVANHRLVVRDRRGQLFVLDVAARRLRHLAERRPRFPGCRLTDVRAGIELHVCGRMIRPVPTGGGFTAYLLGPGRVGHWVWAEFAPRGEGVLAQWSAECEVPVAYLITNGRMRPYGRESVALGWLPSGAALIHFPNGPCAGDSHPARGIYAVPRAGKPHLILRTPRFAQYLMWGG